MVSGPPILLVANSSWNLSHQRGGLIRAFLEEGRWPLAAVVPVGDPPLASMPTYEVPLIADGTAPLAELRSLVGLIAIMRRLRPRIVLGFTPKGNIYAGLAARAIDFVSGGFFR